MKIVSKNQPYAALQPDQTLIIVRPQVGCPEPSAELERAAEGFEALSRRKEFLASRALLLETSSQLLGTDVALEHLRREESGRLAFTHQMQTELRFNLTHSAETVGVAFAVGQSVGVDCDQIVRFGNELKPREQKWLSPEEYDHHESQAKDLVAEQLCLLWTIKEAVTKKSGHGFASGFKTINTLLNQLGVACFKNENEFLSVALPENCTQLLIDAPGWQAVEANSVIKA